MSSSDRILFLTGGNNFKIAGETVDKIPFRNKISITNSVTLRNGPRDIIPSTFTLKSTTDYQDLYVDFTTSGLCFKIPSKNMLIRVDQSNLNIKPKVIYNLMIHHNCATLDADGGDSTTSTLLSQSEFITYKNTSGIITCSHCIPEYYYINRVSRININTGDTNGVSAGDLTLDFYQFD